MAADALHIRVSFVHDDFQGERIMRCDVIAEGIIEAARELHLTTPIVVRLQVISGDVMTLNTDDDMPLQVTIT